MSFRPRCSGHAAGSKSRAMLRIFFMVATWGAGGARHPQECKLYRLAALNPGSAPQVAGAPRDTRTALRNITDALLGRSRNAGH